MENKHNVLVLGGAGYIGTTLAPYLQNNNCNVTVVDTNWFGNYLPSNINTIQKDIFELHQNDLVGFDTVIFLAGLSNDPMAEFSPKDNFIYNTGMPAYIGFLAKEAGVKRFIFASSCSVYGYTHNSTFTEDDVAISNYPYGVSKLQGERSLLALADENFSVVCFRQGTVSGYSPRMRLDLALNTMFKNALSKGEITLSNPKTISFYLALVPSIFGSTVIPTQMLLIILSMTILTLGAVGGLYIFSAVKMQQRIKQPQFQLFLRKLSALIMASFALSLMSIEIFQFI